MNFSTATPRSSWRICSSSSRYISSKSVDNCFSSVMLSPSVSREPRSTELRPKYTWFTRKRSRLRVHVLQRPDVDIVPSFHAFIAVMNEFLRTVQGGSLKLHDINPRPPAGLHHVHNGLEFRPPAFAHGCNPSVSSSFAFFTTSFGASSRSDLQSSSRIKCFTLPSTGNCELPSTVDTGCFVSTGLFSRSSRIHLQRKHLSFLAASSAFRSIFPSVLFPASPAPAPQALARASLRTECPRCP